MAINGRKVAIFVNTKNILEKQYVIEQCRQLEEDVDVFIANKCSTSLDNLGIDVDAKYYDYDYVIVINPFEKAEEEIEHTLLQRQRYYLQNVISDREYLEKEVAVLEESSIEGMLVPHIDYVKSIMKDFYTGWKDYYEQVKEIVKENAWDVIVSQDRAPVISEGGCAIIKTSAIKGFENTKISEDKCTAEIISYALSLYMQEKGYLPGYCMKEKYMISNLLGYGAMNQLDVQHMYPTRKLGSEVYFDTGNSFEVSKAHFIEYIYKVGKKEKLEFKIDIPKGTKCVRFDPLEGNMCLCSEIKTDVPDIKINNFNGIKLGEVDLFLTKDPQYVLEGDFSQIQELTITMEYMSVFWSEHGLKEEMDAIFQEKEELIKAVQHLKTVYGEMEQEKNKKEGELLQKEERLIKSYEELENARIEGVQQQSEIEALKNELAIIKNSKAWKAISKYRNMKNKVFGKNR